jgi:hypothetical protein
MLPTDLRGEDGVQELPERSSQLGQQVEKPQEYLSEKSVELTTDLKETLGVDLKTELESQFSPSEYNTPRVAEQSFTYWEDRFDEPGLGCRDPAPLVDEVRYVPIRDGDIIDAGKIQYHQMETSLKMIKDTPLVTILRTLRVYREHRSIGKEDSFLLGGLQVRLEPLVYGFYHSPEPPDGFAPSDYML